MTTASQVIRWRSFSSSANTGDRVLVGAAAIQIFDSFPGTWRVGQERGNVVAQLFWRNVISRYTNGQFNEVYGAGGGTPIQIFRTPM